MFGYIKGLDEIRGTIRRTADPTIWDLYFHLPFSMLSNLSKSQHKEFLPGLRKIVSKTNAGFPLVALRWHNISIHFSYTEFIRHKAGKLIMRGKFMDTGIRQLTETNEHMKVLWALQHAEWNVAALQNNRIEHKLYFNHPVPEIYISIQNIDTGKNIPLKSAQLILNGNKGIIYLLCYMKHRDHTYKVDFMGAPLNFSRLTDVEIVIVPSGHYAEEDSAKNWRCIVVGPYLNVVAVKEGMTGVMFSN